VLISARNRLGVLAASASARARRSLSSDSFSCDRRPRTARRQLPLSPPDDGSTRISPRLAELGDVADDPPVSPPGNLADRDTRRRRRSWDVSRLKPQIQSFETIPIAELIS